MSAAGTVPARLQGPARQGRCRRQGRLPGLRDFAADLNAHGFGAVGMVQAGQCADSSLSAVLVHNGEKILRYRAALDTWWNGVSGGHAPAVPQVPTAICEILK